MASYMEDRVGLETLESRRATLSTLIDGSCRSGKVRTIHDLGERGFTHQLNPRAGCFYLMGEEFLLELS